MVDIGLHGTHPASIIFMWLCLLVFGNFFFWGGFSGALRTYDAQRPAVCLEGRRIGGNVSFVAVQDRVLSSRSQTVKMQCVIPVAVYPCMDGGDIEPNRWRGDCRDLAAAPLAQWPDRLQDTDIKCSKTRATTMFSASRQTTTSCEADLWVCADGKECNAAKVAEERCQQVARSDVYPCYYVPEEVQALGEEASELDDSEAAEDKEDKPGIYEVHVEFPHLWLFAGAITSVLALFCCGGSVAVAASRESCAPQFALCGMVTTAGHAFWLIVVKAITLTSAQVPVPEQPSEERYRWLINRAVSGDSSAAPVPPLDVGAADRLEEAPPVLHDVIDMICVLLGAVCCVAACFACLARIYLRVKDRGLRAQGFIEDSHEEQLREAYSSPKRSNTANSWKVLDEPVLGWKDTICLRIFLEAEAVGALVQRLGCRCMCRESATSEGRVSPTCANDASDPDADEHCISMPPAPEKLANSPRPAPLDILGETAEDCTTGGGMSSSSTAPGAACSSHSTAIPVHDEDQHFPEVAGSPAAAAGSPKEEIRQASSSMGSPKEEARSPSKCSGDDAAAASGSSQFPRSPPPKGSAERFPTEVAKPTSLSPPPPAEGPAKLSPLASKSSMTAKPVSSKGRPPPPPGSSPAVAKAIFTPGSAPP